MIYRDREAPYTDEGLTVEQKAMRVYFQTHQPAEWRFNSASVEMFRSIYGAAELEVYMNRMTVPENIGENWVTKPIFHDPEPIDPNPTHIGQYKVNAMGVEKWVDDTPPDPTKFSDGERVILIKLNEIMALLQK